MFGGGVAGRREGKGQGGNARAEGKVNNQAGENILKIKAQGEMTASWKCSSFSIGGDPCNVTVPIFLKSSLWKRKIFQTNH